MDVINEATDRVVSGVEEEDRFDVDINFTSSSILVSEDHVSRLKPDVSKY